MGDGNVQSIEILPARYAGTNKTYKIQVALDGVNFIEEPFATLTVQNEGIRDEHDFTNCGKEDIREVVVKHVEAGTGVELAETEVYYGYSVSMVRQFDIKEKTIAGYKVVNKPHIDLDGDYVNDGRTYIFEYVKDDTSGSESTGTWKKDSVGWWYDRGDGTYPASCWEKISREWYYFNSAGYRVTGWQQVNNVWYYFDGQGKMLADEWVNETYYMKSNGAMSIGWLKIDGEWYWFSSSGKKVTGWQQVNSVWYYFDGQGKMLADQWVDSNYYVTASGAMKTGWLYKGREWYYFNASGKKVTSQWIGDYYLKADGKMAVSEWVDNNKYYVGADGLWVPKPRL